MVQNIKYFGYDTLKGYNTDDWSQIKQFATRLKELTKELRMSGYAVFQLSDDTVFTDIFSLSSNNIANAKQIKHVADILNIGKKLNKDEYHKYQMVAENDSCGEPVTEDLDLKKQYFCIKPDKNRAGSKDKIMLFEIDLNLNVWRNIGYIIKRPKNFRVNGGWQLDAKELKNYIYENRYVEQILESIGCHHIKYHASNTYWTCKC